MIYQIGMVLQTATWRDAGFLYAGFFMGVALTLSLVALHDRRSR